MQLFVERSPQLACHAKIKNQAVPASFNFPGTLVNRCRSDHLHCDVRQFFFFFLEGWGAGGGAAAALVTTLKVQEVLEKKVIHDPAPPAAAGETPNDDEHPERKELSQTRG